MIDRTQGKKFTQAVNTVGPEYASLPCYRLAIQYPEVPLRLKGAFKLRDEFGYVLVPTRFSISFMSIY